MGWDTRRLDIYLTGFLFFGYLHVRVTLHVWWVGVGSGDGSIVQWEVCVVDH